MNIPTDEDVEAVSVGWPVVMVNLSRGMLARWADEREADVVVGSDWCRSVVVGVVRGSGCVFPKRVRCTPL
jgi:hypothetical protein